MAGEPTQIRREIAETRQEIDEHLQELGGRVQRGLSVREQTRRNLPMILGASALAGLAIGLFFGGTRRRRRRVERAAEMFRAQVRGDVP
ncbi:MAG: DUF3618 domain-containing protein [Anaerolineae bacterium]|nr:DUF3618 domain-containing protein [Anaerolineae bacterium]